MKIIESYGYFQKKIYRNGDFTVALFYNAATNQPFKVVGNNVPTAKNIRYHLLGESTIYKKTGEQTLQLMDYEIADLGEENSFVEYLAMPPIKLNRLQGKKIYRLFQKQSITILDHDPQQIYNAVFKDLKNGDERYKRFIGEWTQQRQLLKITSFLIRYGINRKDIMKLNAAVSIEQSKDLSAVIKENPYFMMGVSGVHIDISICDEIAKKLQYPINSPERIKAGMRYVLQKAMTNGHMFLYSYGIDGLMAAVTKILSVSAEEVAAVINTRPNGFVFEHDKKLKNYRIYLDYAHEWEVGLAKKIYEYLSKKVQKVMSKNDVEKFLENYQHETGITLAKKQQEAVYAVAKNPITIITGGAGTGKTTSLKAILAMLEASGNDKHCLLASTGKASQHMIEATGQIATTIHHCISCDDSNEDRINYEKSITCDTLIIDEFSMTDCKVAYSLFCAIKSCKRIVIVGDVEQLPSVGAGNVLKDLIQSERICVVALDVIQRQTLDSPIVANAQKILRGENDFVFDDKFRFIETQNGEEAATYIVNRYMDLIQKHGINAVQILSPMKKRICGTMQLNEMIQNQLFPSLHNDKFRIGDKVINTKNKHDIGLNNGDIGYITNIVDDEYSIAFETGATLEFSHSDMDFMMLAYSVTVHKSQGCDYPYVIMPVLNEHSIMLYRNLLYTGITRAKNSIELVGSKEMIKKAIETVKVSQRNTMLAKRLQYADDIFGKKISKKQLV